MLPRLLVFFGLVASGKSTLGGLFARKHGYEHLNTDLIRKELAGVPATERAGTGLDEGIYAQSFSARTYAALLRRAEESLAGGVKGVVLDGSYLRRSDRREVLRLAGSSGEQVVFIFCDCREETVRERLRHRAVDQTAVSDGTWEVYRHQLAAFQPPDELRPQQYLHLSTEKPPAALLGEVERWLDAPGDRES